MEFKGPTLNGRWRLGPRHGRGTQARTYVAQDTQSKQVVIVKQFRLREDSATRKEKHNTGWKRYDLFRREVRILKTLRHPNIPRFVDEFESEPGVFNLVMERAPGATLRAVATRVNFTAGDLRDILRRVLDILNYLHNLSPPVIHRDIKPSNLVRALDGRISLVDFGGVRDALRPKGGSTVVGTFGYMAPEQLHGQATPATDIYSLGATIVALAGGVEPEAVPRKGLKMDLRSHLSSLDPQLVALLEDMTAPDPDNRPQSAQELIARVTEPRPLPALRTTAALKTTPGPSGAIASAFEEVGRALRKVPQPLGTIVRAALSIVGLGGYVGLSIARFVVVSVVFGVLAGILRGDGRREMLEVRDDVATTLDAGRNGFLQLGRGTPPQLPE